MKSYWSIPGVRQFPPNNEVGIAFAKLDGNNLRCEWSKKRGWYKFGTRTRLLDTSDPDFGIAIPLFLNKYGDSLARILTDIKAEQTIVFCELWGPSSFCGIHVPGEELTVTLIDVNIHKKGIVLPGDFIRLFGHLDIPKVIYEGVFDQSFVETIKNSELQEGVVMKGGKKQHALWMVKIKTLRWIQELKHRSIEDITLSAILQENIDEQGLL